MLDLKNKVIYKEFIIKSDIYKMYKIRSDKNKLYYEIVLLDDGYSYHRGFYVNPRCAINYAKQRSDWASI